MLILLDAWRYTSMGRMELRAWKLRCRQPWPQLNLYARKCKEEAEVVENGACRGAQQANAQTIKEGEAEPKEAKSQKEEKRRNIGT